MTKFDEMMKKMSQTKQFPIDAQPLDPALMVNKKIADSCEDDEKSNNSNEVNEPEGNKY